MLAIFVSGGMDGSVILWEIHNDEKIKNRILEKFYEYSLLHIDSFVFGDP